MFQALAAVANYPQGVRFKDQEGGEKVVLLLRKHAATNFHWWFKLGLMVAAPWLLYPLSAGGLGLFDFVPIRYRVVGTFIWYLLTIAYGFLNFIHWFFTVYIITDRRLVDIDYRGFLSYEVTEAALRSVEDVTYRVKGALGILFNYGDVLVQTAAATERVDFLSVPSPEEVHDLVTDLAQAAGGRS